MLGSARGGPVLESSSQNIHTVVTGDAQVATPLHNLESGRLLDHQAVRSTVFGVR